MWLIGDRFVRNTIRENFLKRRSADNLYCTNNFEITALYGGTNMRSVMTCMVNCFINTINSSLSLPKWLIIIPENDLLNDVQYTSTDVQSIYEKELDWIMTQHDMAITRYKGFLPQKSKKFNWPFIMWIVPTLHTGYSDFNLRKLFIKSLRTVAANHNVIVIPLHQVWNIYDENLFSRRSQRYIEDGLTRLWTAIDRTIKYADIRMMRNYGKPMHELFPNNIDEEAEFTQYNSTMTRYKDPMYKFFDRNRHADQYQHRDYSQRNQQNAEVSYRRHDNRIWNNMSRQNDDRRHRADDQNIRRRLDYH